MDQYGIPEIFESQAEGIIQDIYKDIKLVLKVPVVNFVFRALAHYPEFLAMAWEQVRPSMLTANLEQAAASLRYPEISYPFPAMNWTDMMHIEQIQKEIAVFQYVNSKLLLLICAWAESLSNRPVNAKKEVTGYIKPGIKKAFPPIQLIHVPYASPQIQRLLWDIAKKHQAFDVASDFRALAKYPQFLEKAWGPLKSYIGTEEFNQHQAHLKTQAISFVRHQMPYSVHIDRNQLDRIYSPSQVAGIIGLVSLFQNFVPALIIDVEFFRKLLTK